MNVFRYAGERDIIGKVKNQLFFSNSQQIPMIPLFSALGSYDYDPNKSIKSNRQSIRG